MDNAKSTPARAGKNQRPCPVLKGLIAPADCGAQRGSKLDCPADCSFYPFAVSGYDAWLKVDASWASKAMDYVERHFGRAQLGELFNSSLRPTEDRIEGDVLAVCHALYTALFVQRDAAGRILADRWEAEGWPDLNNDERVMMRHRRRSFVTVVEVQKLLDHQSSLCLDALAPGSPPFVLVDRRMTPKLVRFSRLLGWITHYPHFSRLGGVGRIVDQHIWPYWKEVIDNRLAKEQARQRGLTLRELLARDFVWATDMLAELSLDYSQRLYEGVDMYQCAATYKIVGSINDVAAILRNKPDFMPETTPSGHGLAGLVAKFVWVCLGESAGLYEQPAQPDTIATVGEVRLFHDRLAIQVLTKPRYAFARRMVDKLFGPLLRFDSESIVDMAEGQGPSAPKVRASPEVTEVMDKAFAAPDRPQIVISASLQRIREPDSAVTAAGGHAGPPPGEPAAKERTLRLFYRSMLDQRIPALADRTPRESARESAQRPQLLDWMKRQIHQVEANNRRDGTNVSLDWMLDELGLTELK